MSSSELLLILVAVLFPPASVAIISGCSCDLLINIALTLLGFIPGHIHAFWLLYKYSKAQEKFGHNNFTYLGNGDYAAKSGSRGGLINQQAPPAYGTQ